MMEKDRYSIILRDFNLSNDQDYSENIIKLDNIFVDDDEIELVYDKYDIELFDLINNFIVWKGTILNDVLRLKQ